jgi:hypothetical protein
LFTLKGLATKFNMKITPPIFFIRNN